MLYLKLSWNRIYRTFSHSTFCLCHNLILKGSINHCHGAQKSLLNKGYYLPPYRLRLLLFIFMETQLLKKA